MHRHAQTYSLFCCQAKNNVLQLLHFYNGKSSNPWIVSVHFYTWVKKMPHSKTGSEKPQKGEIYGQLFH